jgi:hypothetical protein
MRRVIAMTGGLWLLLIVSLAFNVGFGSTLAVRKVRQMCGGPCGGPDMEPALCQKHLLDSLGLSPDEAERVAIAQDVLMSDIAALRAELAAERSKLGGLLTTERPDESAIQAQLDQMSAVQRRVQARIVEHLLNQRRQLTPEQRAEYDELIRQRVCPCNGAGVDMPCKMHRDGRDAVHEPMDP